MRWLLRQYTGPLNNWELGYMLVDEANGMRPFRTPDERIRVFDTIRDAVEYIRLNHLGSVEWHVAYGIPHPTFTLR